jgi:hypothetical protein
MIPTRRLAVATVLTSAVLLVVGTALAELVPGVPQDMRLPRVGVFVVLAFAVALNGAIILWYRPSNRIGWLLCASGLAGSGEHLAGEYAGAAIFGTALPGGEIAAWIFTWLMVFHLAPLGTFVLLLFPDGRLPSRRWAPVAWAAAGATAAFAIGTALLPGPIPVLGIANPLGWPEFADLMLLVVSVGFVLVALTAALCALSLVLRYGRASGIERLQIRWVAFASILGVAGLVVILVLGLPLATSALIASIAVVPLPTAMAIALMRYRLYDIDVLINRTLVYAGVSALLVAVYVASVVLFQAILRPLTGGSELSVAASTLFVVALFQPVRHRVQDVVDRRFYRSRYDAARTLDAFSVRLRNDVALESVQADLLDVVGATVRPTHASVWLREARR